MFMFNVATQQHFVKTEKVAAVEGGSEAAEIVEVSSEAFAGIEIVFDKSRYVSIGLA